MAKPKTNSDGLRLVLTKTTRSKLAAHLEISRQAVWKWTNGVPPRFVVEVEELTGIPREEILPEMANIFRR